MEDNSLPLDKTVQNTNQVSAPTAATGKKIRPLNISLRGFLIIGSTAIIFLVVVFFILSETSNFPPMPDGSQTSVARISSSPLSLDQPNVMAEDIDLLIKTRSDDEATLKMVRDDFNKAWEASQTDRLKFAAYRNVYSTLWALYNQKLDPLVLDEMNKIEMFLKVTWPEYYEQINESGGFKR